MQEKAPSGLTELKKLVDSMDDGEGSLEFKWLEYTYNTLLARKTYHKKQQLKRKLMMQVASEHLSQDELDSIDKQAEDISEKQIAMEEQLS